MAEFMRCKKCSRVATLNRTMICKECSKKKCVDCGEIYKIALEHPLRCALCERKRNDRMRNAGPVYA